MKKLLILIAICTLPVLTFAQRYAYVDSDYILEKIPEFQAAQEELNKLSTQWQKDVEQQFTELENLYKSYQAEQVLLTDDMRKKREEEIVKKEKEAKDFQRTKFGVEGELFKKRQELIKPIQDKVYNAIKDLASSSGLEILFDRAGQSNVIYADDKLDKSDAVLKKMGVRITLK